MTETPDTPTERTGMTRRRLLGSAAAVGGLSAAAMALPPNVRRALANPMPQGGKLSDIKHVVMLMQENRSFDHYFGTLSGVRGFNDPHAAKLPNGRSVFFQPDPSNPDGYLLPYHVDAQTTAAQAIPSMSHAWDVQHQAWNGGKMDNWLPAHIASDGATVGPYTMGYFERQDIPFQFALADRPQVGHFTDRVEVLDFLAGEKHPALAALGTSCPAGRSTCCTWSEGERATLCCASSRRTRATCPWWRARSRRPPWATHSCRPERSARSTAAPPNCGRWCVPPSS